MERIYNKLVRDNIPDIITSNKETPVTRILNEDEYKKALEEKLVEEQEEVLSSAGAERCEELADMVEVIRALAKLEGKSLGEIVAIADEKKLKRGGFDDRIFLEKVVEKDNDDTGN